MGDWCILQTRGATTLRLAETLREVGFNAWAPITREVRREDDQRSRLEVAVPLMPNFVFVAADRLLDILALAHSPSLQYRVWDTDARRMLVKGHPFFRLFRGGNHRFIPDHELDPLRRMERLPRPKREDREFAIGEKVRTDDAGFAGLTGTVVALRSKGRKIKVEFDKWGFEAEFPSWSLRPVDANGQVHVNASPPERDAA